MREHAKILVVDDEPGVRSFCARVLKQSNFDPILAENGLEGLARFNESGAEIALVISDVNMPVMGGIEMVKQLLELKPKSKVILMSGFSLDDPSLVASSAKACLTLQKPFSPGQILAAVKKCLNIDGEASGSKSGT